LLTEEKSQEFKELLNERAEKLELGIS
jgi:hypothetical protein